MIGKEVREWRERNGYRQADLLKELGIGSRGTLSALENSEKEIPRQMELALIALEENPGLRIYHGRKDTSHRKTRKSEQVKPYCLRNLVI
ncbi:helix-turn-helix domain-containing protein [Roseitranquillus sediminis]|uniref:helix-turn-helix domain-containing protein n=1 Tax=Roseitranquillus sediminis TaxID=2809051 RepID=UPI001D0C4297|nr:helix-turn-helix transcriptional regulator [Roseitranquillus sediminis]MBM9593992.1 helix-turn-helix domain-containing protein [Roseitranquillus sediminis]